MWTKIIDRIQIETIKINDQILKHSLDEQVSFENPSGLELNSTIYKVASQTFNGFNIEYSSPQSNIGNVVMKKHLNYKELLNGNWWIHD